MCGMRGIGRGGTIKNYFWWLDPTLPLSGIHITLIHLVPGILSVRQWTKHSTIQETRSHMNTCEYFLIRLQTSNCDLYRTKLRTNHKTINHIGDYVALIATGGNIFYKGTRLEKLSINW